MSLRANLEVPNSIKKKTKAFQTLASLSRCWWRKYFSTKTRGCLLSCNAVIFADVKIGRIWVYLSISKVSDNGHQWKCVVSFVLRCSHLRYRSRRFDCLLLVFFRRWEKLITRHNLYHKDKNSPLKRAHGRVEIRCRLTLCPSSIGASPLLPKQQGKKLIATKGNRRLSETKWRSLQDSPRARQSLHRVNAEEAYAGEDQRTRQGYTTRPYPEHAHETGHYPIWNEVRFIDGDPQSYTRRVKQAVHIRLLPNNIKWWEWNSWSMDAHDQKAQQHKTVQQWTAEGADTRQKWEDRASQPNFVI